MSRGKNSSVEAAARLADYRGEQDYIETGGNPGDDVDDVGALLPTNGAEAAGDALVSELQDMLVISLPPKDSFPKDSKVGNAICFSTNKFIAGMLLVMLVIID